MSNKNKAKKTNLQPVQKIFWEQQPEKIKLLFLVESYSQ